MIDWSQKELLILAFDHRASFLEKMFGIKGRPPTPQEKQQIEDYKKMIFEGFRLAVQKKVPKDIAGLLVDEEFGAAVLREAKKEGFNFAMPCEKSGQDEFDFDYGEDFAKHIEKFDPTFVKVLVRYNPEGDAVMNKRQLQRLKRLSDYLIGAKRTFLFELIVPATSAQLAKLGGAKEKYDLELRPKLMVDSLKAIQDAGVEPAIWKLEGVDKPQDAKAVVKQAQAGGRKVGVITLGRGESKEKVQEWLTVGAKIPGIIGFAVGRTIFWNPLADFKAGKINRQQSVQQIANTYVEFVELWLKESKR
ncbi:MAG: 2-deoxy-5-keto-D-gluconate 6-phosphate aldolase domain-containing protein [Betaproteobacteria bacterium]